MSGLCSVCYRVSGEYTEVCSQVLLLQGVWRVHWGMFPGVAATGCLESTLGYAPRCCCYRVSGEYTGVCSQVLLLQGVWRVH